MKETDIVQALRRCEEGECKDCAMHEDKQSWRYVEEKLWND